MTDPSADLALQKQLWRDRLRFRRRHFRAGLDNLARAASFRVIPAPLAEILAHHGAVGCYTAWGDEPDILPMLTPVADNGGLGLPRHEARIATMDFRRWRPGSPLTKGPWGPAQPSGDADSMVPTLIFCPLVGFDRNGARIGQGGGHYDRYFAAHPAAHRIGVAWSVQEIDAVPAEPTDIALDAVLTEQEFIVCGERL